MYKLKNQIQSLEEEMREMRKKLNHWGNANESQEAKLEEKILETVMKSSAKQEINAEAESNLVSRYQAYFMDLDVKVLNILQDQTDTIKNIVNTQLNSQLKHLLKELKDVLKNEDRLTFSESGNEIKSELKGELEENIREANEILLHHIETQITLLSETLNTRWKSEVEDNSKIIENLMVHVPELYEKSKFELKNDFEEKVNIMRENLFKDIQSEINVIVTQLVVEIDKKLNNEIVKYMGLVRSKIENSVIDLIRDNVEEKMLGIKDEIDLSAKVYCEFELRSLFIFIKLHIFISSLKLS